MLDKEIERKFKVMGRYEELAYGGYKHTWIEQGYLSFDGTEIRVRIRSKCVPGESREPISTMTLKQGSGVTRTEVEFPISHATAEKLMKLAEPYVIRKTRFEVGRWELDFFENDQAPPIAEVELISEDELLPYCKFVDKRLEVTHDPAFLNKNIALRIGSQAMAKAGYHLRHIPKGILGQPSKIREELEELEDAAIQGNRILQLVELSDIVGAVKHYAGTVGTTLEECVAMADATERAFKVGER